jgi:hypothetical protein
MFLSEIDPKDVKKLPLEEKTKAVFRGTCALSEFAEKQVCPIIMSQVGRSTQEQALWATYCRMSLFLRSLAKLDDSCHFQMAAIAARSVFELLLDLKSLAADSSLAQKFFDFTWVSRYHKAKQLANFLSANPAVDATPHLLALALVQKPGVQQNREQLCVQHGWVDAKGKPKWPEHWSGTTIAQRAKAAGIEYEEIYRSEFFIQSYYVHAGGAGIDSMSREALMCAFGIAHALIQRLFAEATGIIADQFHLFAADPQLRDRLKTAALSGGFFALQAMLRDAGDRPKDASEQNRSVTPQSSPEQVR